MALRAELHMPEERSFSLFRTADQRMLSVEQAFSLFCDSQVKDSNGIDCDRDRDWDGEIVLHPSIGLGMLRGKKVASGRLWLLLRFLDKEGRGWLDLSEVRHTCTSAASPIKICGPRHLRTLIAQGEGIFWQKNNGRLWLRSVPRVAATLEVARLDGRPVAIPVDILTKSIGQVRAHLYAAFHSGRKNNNPISRATLKRLSQVSPRSQQNYEKRAHVGKQGNFATGPRLNSSYAQECAWQRGPACFTWQDKKGKLGQKGAAYLAWQLPNSYDGPHDKRPNGNRKRINRQLADLSNIGMMGNGRVNGEFVSKRYWAGAKAAVQHAGAGQPIAYWPAGRRGLWYMIGSEHED